MALARRLPAYGPYTALAARIRAQAPQPAAQAPRVIAPADESVGAQRAAQRAGRAALIPNDNALPAHALNALILANEG